MREYKFQYHVMSLLSLPSLVVVLLSIFPSSFWTSYQLVVWEGDDVSCSSIISNRFWPVINMPFLNCRIGLENFSFFFTSVQASPGYFLVAFGGVYGCSCDKMRMFESRFKQRNFQSEGALSFSSLSTSLACTT